MNEETNTTVAEVMPVAVADAETSATAPAESVATEPVEAEFAASVDPAEETTDAEQFEDDQSAESEAEDEASKSNVRLLSVGQQATGVVKRISEFGAFVDIGVGRDGLVHISELSPRRVAKVTDVLQQGQTATFWIKKLDRDRNRISLTMIEPGTKTIRNMEKGDVVQGTVTRLMPYGAFVDIGIGRDALLHVREMGERYVAKPEDVVQVGDMLDARIIEISRRRARVDLSIKGLRPEPEPEPMPEVKMPERRQAPPPPAPEEELEDVFAEMEVLSPFEAALRRAEQASGTKLNLRKENKRNRRSDGNRSRTMLDDIMERTLHSSGKK
jgi:transcriptional accessory protein Tex/SPT6